KRGREGGGIIRLSLHRNVTVIEPPMASSSSVLPATSLGGCFPQFAIPSLEGPLRSITCRLVKMQVVRQRARGTHKDRHRWLQPGTTIRREPSLVRHRQYNPSVFWAFTSLDTHTSSLGLECPAAEE